MKKFIIAGILVVIIGILIFVGTKVTKPETIMNEGFVNGNTAGNLYNGGLFCENNGTVFFSNPSDGGKLYSMDLNGNNLQKLSDDVATYINADENYVYYVRNNAEGNLNFHHFAFHPNALVRIDRDGENLLILDTEPCLYASLLGNYVYYIHYDKQEASTLYRVRIDGKEQEKVLHKGIFTCNADGQYFYYNGMDSDGNIHRFDTTTNTSTTVYEGNCFQPIVNNGNDVYYIDGDSNYAIVHTNIEFNNPTYITKDSVDSYNVYGSYIYYQRFDEESPALCVVKNDGSESQVILEGSYCDIHVTSYYVFFRDFYTGEMYYFLRTNPNSVERFYPGVIEE